jgi:hypothetical protein
MDIWERLKPEFSKSENWGNPDKINGLLLILLQIIRKRVGYPIHINNAFRDEKGKSQHPKGNAVDFYFKGLNYLEACYRLEQCLKELQVLNHVGLGIYLDWNTRGFHLDVRGERARWSRIEGEYKTMEEGIKQLLEAQSIPDSRYANLKF